MISLAQEFRDSIEFVFKPHPRLRPKLEQLDEWGIEKTNSYYEKWEEMPNTNFVDGDYFDLFLTSDAMIHDCSTFMAEYLLTYKPVMFVLRDESSLDLNEYGRSCLKQHYIGHNFQCIRNFLCEVVLEGRDEMKNQRLEFVNRELKANRQEMVSEAIYREIKKDFS